MGNLPGGFFYWMVRIWQEVILTTWTILKLKTTFGEYYLLIKIKISMSCVYKGYAGKIKMVQEQWLQLKIKTLLGDNMKTVY